MKNYILYLIFIMGFGGCDLQNSNSDFIPLIPENTPFIVGVLEATEDTVHHYPEVYVGTVSNPENFEAERVWASDGIWWPITNIAVTRPATRNDFKHAPDIDAKVFISGPLGASGEKSVEFTHISEGIYGDINNELSLIAGKKYKLFVILSNGRTYTSITQIPELFNWEVPKSIELKLELGRSYEGISQETNMEKISFPFTVGQEVGYVIDQRNSEYDHYIFDTPPGGFLFEDRGNFLREGSGYGIYDAADFPDIRSTGLSWFGSANKTLRNSEQWWLSLSQLNIELSNFYYGVVRFIGGEPDGRWDRQDQARLKARVERDTTFFFGISNILKVDKEGNVLPKEQTDAIGVFGAYSAAYRNITVIPRRSWDPDTLNWGNQGVQ